VAEDYVHRIGRTGRAGLDGEAISLVCVDEHALLRDIEKLTGRRIRQEVLEGYEPDASIPAEPIRNGRNGGGRSRARNGNPGARPSGRRRNRGRSRGRNTQSRAA
jgi:ATP-dependent RNA helicase RhlE